LASAKDKAAESLKDAVFCRGLDGKSAGGSDLGEKKGWKEAARKPTHLRKREGREGGKSTLSPLDLKSRGKKTGRSRRYSRSGERRGEKKGKDAGWPKAQTVKEKRKKKKKR